MSAYSPPTNYSDTSQAAAAFIAPHAAEIRSRVLAFIRSRGSMGATIAETADALGVRTATVCGRMKELEGYTYGDGGKALTLPVEVYDSGRRRTYGDSRIGAKVFLAVVP